MRSIEDFADEIADEQVELAESIQGVWDCDPDAFALHVRKLVSCPREDIHIVLAEFRDFLTDNIKQFYTTKLEANRRYADACVAARDDNDFKDEA